MLELMGTDLNAGRESCLRLLSRVVSMSQDDDDLREGDARKEFSADKNLGPSGCAQEGRERRSDGALVVWRRGGCGDPSRWI